MSQKTFDKHLGLKPLPSKKGCSRVKLVMKPDFLNHGGIAHGGALATLCDVTLAEAISTLLEKNEWCITAELNIYYINPVFPGETIFGFGKVLRKGKTVAFVEGGIETKSKKLIAKARGIWVIKTRPGKRVKAARIMH